MYKIRSRSKHILIVGICICSIYFGYTFAWSINGNGLFDDLLKLTEQSAPIDQIFDGSISVDNLYKQSLKMVKSQNMNILKDSIQGLTQLISDESKTSVQQEDILNILYDSKTANSQIASLMGSLTKREDNLAISETGINASYQKLSGKIPSCTRDKEKIVLDERACIKNRISTQYYNMEQSSNDINIIKTDNFGEDLFTNGSIDDSAYDILVDIDNVGKLLFTSFIGPKETLFYKKPAVKKDNSSNGGPLSIADLLAMVNSAGNNDGRNISSGSTDTNNSGGNTSNNSGTSTTKSNQNGTNSNPSTDNELEKFISTSSTRNISNTSSSNTTNNTVSPLGINQGNMCIPTVSAGNSNTITTTSTTITDITTIEEYLNEVDKANDELIVNNDYTPDPIANIDLDNMTDNQISAMNQLIEENINGIFDEESTKKCTDKCTVGSRSDQLVCKAECLCFSIQYPKTSIEGLDGQLKVRFCTIPVQKNRVSKQKDILGRDDSLSRIKTVFENLLNGGEMMKYERPKEYLENPVGAIQRSKYISFEIKLYIKSLFQNTSKKERENKTNNQTKQTENNIKASTPHVTIDPNQFKVSSKTNDSTTSYDKTQTDLKRILQNAKNKKNIMFNEKIGQFLEENDKFRFNVTDQINLFNNGAASIRKALSTKQ